MKSRRDHVTTTTTGGIGVLESGDGGVVTSENIVSLDVTRRRFCSDIDLALFVAQK